MLQSDEDWAKDLFFAQSSGVWESCYSARHDGFSGAWTGTKETVELKGKNKLSDFFWGADGTHATDDNLLVLTDDANGDALFLDDLYSALPATLKEQQARVLHINGIRAGAGNDVIDLTSQRFAFAGELLTVHGGLGDDVIWGNNLKFKDRNMLFGDAGDDRIVGSENNDLLVGGAGDDSIHGGGGDDIFAFGGDWGHDTIDQLDTGTVTLCFEKGSKSKWNAKTRTYTDGANSVTVLGTSTVNLKFGAEIPNLEELQAYGAFLECTSERVFEDKNKGLLA